jgi:hypothetical protein
MGDLHKEASPEAEGEVIVVKELDARFRFPYLDVERLGVSNDYL